jgi:site-specific DNA recombinase
MQRSEDLEATVWNDACELLSEPERLREEFERRQHDAALTALPEGERLRGAIRKAQRGINRLLDAYTDGLVATREFEPRIRRLRERLTKLQADLQTFSHRVHEQQELRLPTR